MYKQYYRNRNRNSPSLEESATCRKIPCAPLITGNFKSLAVHFCTWPPSLKCVKLPPVDIALSCTLNGGKFCQASYLMSIKLYSNACKRIVVVEALSSGTSALDVAGLAILMVTLKGSLSLNSLDFKRIIQLIMH